MSSENAMVKMPGGDDTSGGIVPADFLFRPSYTWTTFNMEDEEQARRYLIAKSAADLNFDGLDGHSFPVEHIIVHQAESTNPETGQVDQFLRTVLVAPDGRSVGFGSIGVVNSLRDLIAAYKMPPWKPARWIRVVRRKARGQGYYYLLLPAEANGQKTHEQPETDTTAQTSGEAGKRRKSAQ